MIIKSLLDTDLYKLTMGQVVFHRFPDAMVKYRFKCRNKNIRFTQDMYFDILEEFEALDDIRICSSEISYLRSLGLFRESYLEFLRIVRLKNSDIITNFDHDSGELDLTIRGHWFNTIYYEVPVLAIISEVYCKHAYDKEKAWEEGERRLDEKIEMLNTHRPFLFADFGTRRRFSFDWHKHVIKKLYECGVKFRFKEQFVGTSNVFFAAIYNLKPIGTMAHEFIQAAQRLGSSLINSQKFALQTWADEYRGDLGIALSDTLGMDAFLRDFDKYFCKLFDGARHDSGDPREWCRKLISHYESLGIDPAHKHAVFSDGLDFRKASELSSEFGGRIKTSFGIGTNLTNDTGFEPLNIVIKMVECNGRPVAKISDSPGKQMCEDEEYLSFLKKEFDIS